MCSFEMQSSPAQKGSAMYHGCDSVTSPACLNIFLSQMQLMTEGTTAIETISMNKTIFPKKNTEASCNSSNFMTCFHRFN